MTAVTTSHIVLDNRGRAYVEGTRTRVAMIVMDKMNGMNPEQIKEAYPYLSLSMIYSALAFYYDHKEAIDAEIAREAEEIATMRGRAENTSPQPTRQELERRRTGSGPRA